MFKLYKHDKSWELDLNYTINEKEILEHITSRVEHRTSMFIKTVF